MREKGGREGGREGRKEGREKGGRRERREGRKVYILSIYFPSAWQLISMARSTNPKQFINKGGTFQRGRNIVPNLCAPTLYILGSASGSLFHVSLAIVSIYPLALIVNFLWQTANCRPN